MIETVHPDEWRDLEPYSDAWKAKRQKYREYKLHVLSGFTKSIDGISEMFLIPDGTLYNAIARNKFEYNGEHEIEVGGDFKKWIKKGRFDRRPKRQPPESFNRKPDTNDNGFDESVYPHLPNDDETIEHLAEEAAGEMFQDMADAALSVRLKLIADELGVISIALEARQTEIDTLRKIKDLLK